MLTILIAALGGEGGGTLLGWLAEAARSAGFLAQATSVPGVAQRTGATSYYIEIARRSSQAGRAPVFALSPLPGRVDVAVASEMVEAGRLMERGFVSPSRTTLVMSTSRVYATAEKIAMGDGRFSSERIEAAAARLARRVVALDLDQLARDNGTMVSATMLGALAGAGLLPWPRETCERVIGAGRSSAASRAGFAAAFAAAAPVKPERDIASNVAPPPVALAPAIKALPAWLHDVARLGADRCADFQDKAYAQLYAERLSRLVAAEAVGRPEMRHAVVEAARRLALWMSYEDVARVADLKTRSERFARIRRECEMKPGQLLHVTEYLKPGAEEVAAMLPAPLGRRMMARLARGGSFPLLGYGVHVRSTGAGGHLLLRLVATLKHLRRHSLRYSEEQAAIELWLEAMRRALDRSPAFAGALAELPRVLKGYSDTQTRGRRSYDLIFAHLVKPALDGGMLDDHASSLRKAMAAALTDPDHVALDELIANVRAPRPEPALSRGREEIRIRQTT